jgi:cytochrome b involved in lipid metabolism
MQIFNRRYFYAFTLGVLFTAIILLISTGAFSQVKAIQEISASEVAKHDQPGDCYMIYDNKVYDLSDYIPDHDRYLDIKNWCGEDMTEDFETKAGLNRDHKNSSYALLENYYLGDLDTGSATTSSDTEEHDEDELYSIEISGQEIKTGESSNTSSPSEVANNSTITPNNPYHLLLPLLGSAILYIGHYLVSHKIEYKKKYKLASKNIFNMVWNTVLLVTLIPAAGFGIFMVIRYSIPDLYAIDFDFTYWHVEGSIVMGTVATLHLITRLKIYLSQIKSLTK